MKEKIIPTDVIEVLDGNSVSICHCEGEVFLSINVENGSLRVTLRPGMASVISSSIARKAVEAAEFYVQCGDEGDEHD